LSASPAWAEKPERLAPANQQWPETRVIIGAPAFVQEKQP
jgi:hypothetical protein